MIEFNSLRMTSRFYHLILGSKGTEGVVSAVSSSPPSVTGYPSPSGLGVSVSGVYGGVSSGVPELSPVCAGSAGVSGFTGVSGVYSATASSNFLWATWTTEGVVYPLSILAIFISMKSLNLLNFSR